MKMNKIGEEHLLSIWWFLCLGFVAAGIVIGTLIFYTADFDARSLEAEILANKVLSCAISAGKLKENFFTRAIFKECHLDKKVIGESFYFKIEVLNTAGNSIGKIDEGDHSFESDCKISASNKINAKNYPLCYEQESGIVYEGSIAKIKVIAGSNNKKLRAFS
jgi:hypothetical protein